MKKAIAGLLLTMACAATHAAEVPPDFCYERAVFAQMVAEDRAHYTLGSLIQTWAYLEQEKGAHLVDIHRKIIIAVYETYPTKRAREIEDVILSECGKYPESYR